MQPSASRLLSVKRVFRAQRTDLPILSYHQPTTQTAFPLYFPEMATIQPASFLAIGWMAWCFVGRRTGWMA
jgi:hypothetical protein